MTDQPTPTTTITTHRLVGWGTFEDLRESILARLFGHMVVLAQPVVEEYHSDLFHDASWLRANVTGETEFEFVVRTSGTNLGVSAKYAATSPGAVLYTMTLRAETRGGSSNADWYLDIAEHLSV